MLVAVVYTLQQDNYIFLHNVALKFVFAELTLEISNAERLISIL